MILAINPHFNKCFLFDFTMWYKVSPLLKSLGGNILMMESFSVTADQESSLDLNMTNDSKASSLKDDFYLPKIKKIQI